MEKVVMTIIFLLVAVPLYAKEMIIFTGIPEMKISEGGVNRVLDKLDEQNAIQFKCTITKNDDKYYWTSRENIELISMSSGAFITYWAVNGSGYVRVVKPEMKKEVKLIGALAKDPEGQYDYVEHLLLGLKSVTYYGQSK